MPADDGSEASSEMNHAIRAMRKDLTRQMFGTTTTTEGFNVIPFKCSCGMMGDLFLYPNAPPPTDKKPVRTKCSNCERPVRIPWKPLAEDLEQLADEIIQTSHELKDLKRTA